jgi:2-polyprenyl-3-methyl-5-hydroxy-6-metoxy-1,4-benzoquinol methylase
MPLIPDPESDSFRRFAARLDGVEVVDALASASGRDAGDVQTSLALALGEAAQTLRVLRGIELPEGARLLEVGAGLGVTSAYLSTCGYRVTALEPGGQGFEQHLDLGVALRGLIGSDHEQLTSAAEDLDASVHGTFDLVFSNNVIEHVGDPELVMRQLVAVTSAGGWCVHSCPNYRVPFEPHFGIPLLPVRPSATARVLPKRIRTDPVWLSLNFVTDRHLRRVASTTGSTLHLRRGALATSVERLGTDPEFRRRHRALGGVAAVGRRLGLTALLRRLPASWSTPMDFVLAGRGLEPTAVERWLHA